MDPQDMMAVQAVAKAVKAAIVLASMAGMDLLSESPSLLLDFAPEGDITITLMVDGAEVDSGTITSANIAAYLAEDMAEEADEAMEPVDG
jgi:hypothetical protein